MERGAQLVRHSLRDWGQPQLTEDTEIIASVTNAVEATHSPVGDRTDLRDLPLVGVELQMAGGKVTWAELALDIQRNWVT